MADSPRAPKDSGKISLPALGPGMNRRAPSTIGDYDDPKRLGLHDDGPDEDDTKLLERIRKRFDRCLSHEGENRKGWTVALQFKGGKQWSDAQATQRNIDQRPCLTINRLPTFIRQVTNDQRMNRPAINVSPVGSKGDPDAAKMYRGLIRSIERKCGAEIAYDTAFDSAVSIGVGYWRIFTEWESENSFHQTIVVKRVANPMTIYLDPDSTEPDGADAKFGFVTELIPKDEFEEKWPDAAVTNFDMGGQGDKYKAWDFKDGVRVCEYFEVVKKPRTLILLDNGFTGFEDELNDIVKQRIKKNPDAVIEKRDSYERSIKWYKVTAIEVLEREDWLGKWIPIVKVIGNELNIDGKIKLTGLIEPAMDSQRMFNYYKTKEAEAVALAPMAPFVMTEGQVEGHEDEWRNANRTANPVLFYKPDDIKGHPVPPPQRITAPGIPEGFVHGAESAAMDIMATTGIRFDMQTDHRSVNDASGKAIKEFRKPEDLGASHYMDNLKRSLLHTGNIFIDLIPKVYDEKRQMMILREDDTEQKVQIDPHAPQAHKEGAGGPQSLPTFNPTIGEYGVTVTIGPSFATRRIEAAEQMMEFAKAFPHAGPMIMDLVAKDMDWDGAQEMAARLAKGVPPQLLTPEQKDVPPQVQAFIQHQNQQIAQLTEQLKQAVAGLNDKEKDRAVALEKIARDFEAKLLAVMEKSETAQAKVMAENVRTMIDALDKREARAHAEQNPEPEGQKPGKEKTNA